jgi:hypothetical protein
MDSYLHTRSLYILENAHPTPIVKYTVGSRNIIEKVYIATTFQMELMGSTKNYRLIMIKLTFSRTYMSKSMNC